MQSMWYDQLIEQDASRQRLSCHSKACCVGICSIQSSQMSTSLGTFHRAVHACVAFAHKQSTCQLDTFATQASD